nr:unnamed protein product [Callosobruchus analis]
MSFIQCSCYENNHPFSLSQAAFSSETIHEQDTRSTGIGVNEEELERQTQNAVETRSEQTDLDCEETHYVLQVDENIECVLYVSEENLCSYCDCWSEGGNYVEPRNSEELRNKYASEGESLQLQTSVVDYQTLICHETAERGTTADLLMTTDMLNRSVLDMMSPIVASRYHGSKCCVEINVMEKHGDGCRYNGKQINLQNSDSYSLIRRLNILTCSMGDSPVEEPLPPKIILDDIYPVLTETHPPGFKLPEEQSDDKLSILEDCIKNKHFLDTLVRSSKSFPNFKSAHEVAVHTADRSAKHSDVQELFLHQKFDRYLETTDKSIQIEAKRWRRKKWFYSLFACMLPQY